MSKSQLDCPLLIFLSMCVHYSILLLYFSSLKEWGTQQAQRFDTPRWLWRILITLPDEMFSASYISSCDTLRPVLISDFAKVTTVTGRPQRLSFSGVCHLNWNPLNHLASVDFAGDVSQTHVIIFFFFFFLIPEKTCRQGSHKEIIAQKPRSERSMVNAKEQSFWPDKVSATISDCSIWHDGIWCLSYDKVCH